MPGDPEGGTTADAAEPFVWFDAATVLLLADEGPARTACDDYVIGSGDTDVLVVTYDPSLDVWVRELQGRRAERAAGVTVLGVGDASRSATTGATADLSTGGTPHVAVDSIPDPTDLRTLSRAITGVLDDRLDTAARPVVWIHSTGRLLDAVGLETAFRFLHTLNHRLATRGIQGFVHLERDRVDERAINTLRPLFDVVVSLSRGSSPPVYPTAEVSLERLDTPTPELDGLETAPGEASSDPERGGGPADGTPDGPSAVPPAHVEGLPDGSSVSPIRVLVVESRSDVAELIASVLDGAPRLEVSTVTDPDAAFDVLDGVDCVVSGTDLSTTTGPELAGRIRERDPDLPFLLLADDPETVPDGSAVTRAFARDREGYRAVVDYVPVAVERARNRRFRLAVENAGEPLVIARVDGTVEYVNEAFEALTGRAADPHRDFRDLFATEAIADGWAAVRDGDAWTGETELARDGDPFPVRVSLSPVTDERGDVTRVIAIAVDVSEYEARERELAAERDRAEETVDRLVHDLRNLIQVLRGDLGAVREAIDGTERSVDRVESLVGDAPVAMGDVSVGEATDRDLGTVADEVWADAGTAGGELVVEGSAPVRADQPLLGRLLDTLFRDAVQRGGESVRVRVGTLDDGFYVADDGPGPPGTDREGGSDGRDLAAEGAGLERRVAASIADAHGWSVEVGESEGGGARIEVTGVPIG